MPRKRVGDGESYPFGAWGLCILLGLGQAGLIIVVRVGETLLLSGQLFGPKDHCSRRLLKKMIVSLKKWLSLINKINVSTLLRLCKQIVYEGGETWQRSIAELVLINREE